MDVFDRMKKKNETLDLLEFYIAQTKCSYHWDLPSIIIRYKILFYLQIILMQYYNNIEVDVEDFKSVKLKIIFFFSRGYTFIFYTTGYSQA